MTLYPIRHSARILLLDEQDRILLLHVNDGEAFHHNRPEMITFWITPGGGVESGESYEETARRELWEETGIADATFGPCLWHQERLLHFPTRTLLLQEQVYLARVQQPQVTLANLLPYEQKLHQTFHWWRVDELAQSHEQFMPPRLATLLPPILVGIYPAEPLQLNCTP